jgi:hypothetical protein
MDLFDNEDNIIYDFPGGSDFGGGGGGGGGIVTPQMVKTYYAILWRGTNRRNIDATYSGGRNYTMGFNVNWNYNGALSHPTVGTMFVSYSKFLAISSRPSEGRYWNGGSGLLKGIDAADNSFLYYDFANKKFENPASALLNSKAPIILRNVGNTLTVFTTVQKSFEAKEDFENGDNASGTFKTFEVAGTIIVACLFPEGALLWGLEMLAADTILDFLKDDLEENDELQKLKIPE